MGSLTGTQILGRVQTTLLDETGVQWDAAELTEHIAASFNTIVQAKPDAYVKNQAIQLEEGTLQSIPADGLALVRIVRNAGEDGLSIGRAISFMDMVSMDKVAPDWHNHQQSYTVRQYAHDPRDPKHFYVYPPHKFPGRYVDAVLSSLPPRYSDVSQPIPIDDIYEDAIYYYVLSNAYAKNAKRGDTAKATSYLQLFYNALGLRSQAQKAVTAGAANGAPK